MKKLLLTILCTITFYSYAEVNTKVYNNYLVLSDPEYAPHSIPIKHQEISSDIEDLDLMVDESIDTRRIIESNSDGFITYINTRKYNMISNIDYTKKTIFITMGHNTAQLNLIFTDNIKEILFLDGDYSKYSYDKNDKLIEVNSKINTTNKKVNIIYSKEGLVKVMSSNNIDVEQPKLILESDKKEFIYNNDNKLIELIQTGITNSNFPNISNDDSNNGNRVIHCYFIEYSEHGDWTKGNCIKDGNINLGDITRKLEYWE